MKHLDDRLQYAFDIWDIVLIAITRPNGACIVSSQTVVFSMAKTNSSRYANERYLEQRFSGFSEDVASRILFVGCGWCDCDLPCTFWMSRRTGWSTFFWKWWCLWCSFVISWFIIGKVSLWKKQCKFKTSEECEWHELYRDWHWTTDHRLWVKLNFSFYQGKANV